MSLRALTHQLWLFAFLLLSAVGIKAQEAVKTTPILANQGTYLIQVFLGLIFVVGLIFSMGWLLKRMGQGTLGGSQQLKVVASLSLGTREKIALVQVGEKQLLLGITPNAINTLQSFDEPVFTVETAHSDSDFSQKLKTLLSNKPVKS